MKPERLRVPKDPPKDLCIGAAKIDGKWRYIQQTVPVDSKTTMRVLDDGSVEFVTENREVVE
jgi:hypothetical protein